MNLNRSEDHFFTEMEVLNEKVYYACSHVNLLNQEIELLKIRYSKALKHQQPSFRYSLRLQLATHEGVRETILQYAHMLARKMDTIEEAIISRRAARNMFILFTQKVLFRTIKHSKVCLCVQNDSLS